MKLVPTYSYRIRVMYIIYMAHEYLVTTPFFIFYNIHEIPDQSF